METNNSDYQTQAFEGYTPDYSGTIHETEMKASADMTNFPMTPMAIAMLNYGTDAPQPTTELRQGLLGGGMDMAQGQMEKGVGEVLRMAGFDGAAEKMLEWSKQNVNDAMVDRDGLVDDVVFTAGQIAVPIAIAGAAAMAAPAIGATAVVGSALAGFAAAWGMTAGDFFMKEEELDEDYEPNVGDLAITGLLALPEAVGVLKGAKLLKPFAQAVEGAGTKAALQAGAKVDPKDMSRLGEYSKSFVKNFAEQGALEAGQDFTGSLTANIRTGVPIDAERVISVGKGAAYEGLIGGIFGGPLGTAQTYKSRVAREEADLADKKVGEARQEFLKLQDEDGNLSEDYKQLVPVTGAARNPGLMTLGATVLVGNATDRSRQKFGHLTKVKNILDNFNTKYKERQVGQFTINEKARGLEGEFHTLAKDFNKGKESNRIAAWDAIANGEVLDTKEFKSLTKLLHDTIPEETKARSRKMIETGEGWLADNTYLPTMVTMDFNKMNDVNWDTLAVEAEADLVARGDMSPAEIKSQMGALKQSLNSYKQTGDHLSFARMGKDTKPLQNVLDRLEGYKEKGEKITDKQRKNLKSSMAKESLGSNRKSPIVLDRMLGKFSQKFLNNYRKAEDPRGALNAHIRMVSEHLAMVDTFGVDNVLFDEAMIEAVADSYNVAIDEGDVTKAMNADDVERMYDILRTQQRIHLKPLQSERVRTIQNNTRAVANTMLLGLSALVSIPEALVIFMNTGGKASLQGLAQTIRLTTKGRHGEAMLASEQLGYTIRTAIDHAINRTGEESFEVSKWENSFIRWTGLPYLQHFLTVWAARANDVHLKDMTKKLSTETNVEKRNYMTAMIEEAGLDVDKMLNWADGDFSEDSEFFVKSYIPAVVGLTHDTVVDPHPVDKPLWMNNEHLLLLTQLKGFMTVFTNRVMRKWGHEVKRSPKGNITLATKVAPYVAMYIAAQVGMQAVREVLKKGDLDDWDEKDMSDRVINAFGYLGSMGYFVDFYSSLLHRSDPLASIGGPVLSKSLNSSRHLVNAVEQQDPEAFVQKMAKELFPNMPGKDLILEAFGVE